MKILDSTLREGELFRVLPPESRVRLASRLADSGVSRVELTVDYPPRTTAAEILPVVRALRDRGVEVVMHGRACQTDVEAISQYDVQGAALYIAVSRLHREHKLHGISGDEAIDRLCEGVEEARRAGFSYIRATLEDASRVYLEEKDSGLRLIHESVGRLARAGATIVSIPDTSGLMTPSASRSFFRDVRRSSSFPLAAHFHNDYGFASANTIEAGLEGADELHVTVMGVGDRNGIADLYEVAATLEDVYRIHTGIDRRSLRGLYSFFSKASGVELPWRHPLSEEAQTVRAGVHQSMTVRREDGYIPAAKLANDFGEPRYAVSQYISHNLVQTILAPYSQVGPEGSRRVAEALAQKSAGGLPNVRTVRDVILNETGVDVPDAQLRRYFGAERVYVLLKLQPQYPAGEIVRALSELDGVDGVDEVYGDVDMVVRAHTSETQNAVTIIRQRWADAIQDMKVLVTD